MRCPLEIVVTSDSSSENWSAATWDPCTGSLLSSYKHATSLGNRTLQLLSDSYVIGADSTKPRLHIWPLNSQTPVSNVRLFTPGKVSALTATPNGHYIVVAVAEKLYVWQLCNGRLLNTFTRHYQVINCLTFNKEGSCFASGSEDGLIFVWSMSQILCEKEAKPMCSFSYHSLPVKDLYFGLVGAYARLYSVSLDRSMRIYDVNEGILLLTLTFDAPLTAICADAIENNVFVGTSTGQVMKCFMRDPPRGYEAHVDATDNEKVTNFKGHQGSIVALSVSVDCITLLSASTDGSVHLWDIPSGQVIRTLQHKSPITSAFFEKAYDNFSGANYKPNLTLQPLQKTLESSEKDTFVEVLWREHDDSWLTDANAIIGNVSNAENTTDCKNKLLKACNDNERIKNVNTQLYQYAVKYIFDQGSRNDT